MFAKIVKVTKVNTLIVLAGISLSGTHSFAQGTQGPDTAGVAIGSVGKNAVLVRDLLQIEGSCQAKIVDELVNTVSAGSVRVTGVSPKSGSDFFKFSTNKNCDFFTQRFGLNLYIRSSLEGCPNEFPTLAQRKVALISPTYNDNGYLVPVFKYATKTEYKLDPMGNVVFENEYALNPLVEGRSSGNIEFQGYVANSLGEFYTGVVVFKYPVLKYRECLQTGLSSLAK